MMNDVKVIVLVGILLVGNTSLLYAQETSYEGLFVYLSANW